MKYLQSLIRVFKYLDSSSPEMNQQPFDLECLDQVLLAPVWNVLDRPSKLIRAMLVMNFNELAGIQNQKDVQNLAAFIEVLHTLTLIIGKIVELTC